MDNKNSSIFCYDEERAKTSKSPIIVALTKRQHEILIDVIWKQFHDPLTPYCIESLDLFHTDVIPKYKEKKFTHYVFVLSEDNVKDWLKTISKFKWSTEDTLVWKDEYQMVFDVRYLTTRSIQYVFNEVVEDYLRSNWPLSQDWN